MMFPTQFAFGIKMCYDRKRGDCMYFDTHCHLNSEQLYAKRAEYVQNALAQGVSQMVVVGYDLAVSELAVSISQEFDQVYAAVGIGPEDCLNTDELELSKLEALLEKPKVVALGEIGLDYHWDTVPPQKQKDIFRAQLALAKKHQKIVIIHCRDAMQDTYEILKEAGVTGIMHCYSGSIEMARRFIELGFKISLAGPVTFKNARVPKEVAAGLDLKDLLIETDAPYLAPTPLRGQTNEPANVVYTAKEIALLRGVSVEEVAKQTTKNAREVFKI